MKLGDAFLMSVPPNFHVDHLFFVISDPQAHGGTFLIANITGDQFRAGEECTLAKGEHPWIKKECFVAFADALKITPAQCQMIEALVGTRVRLQPSLSPETLAKIVSAAKQSKAIPVGFKKYL
jgi:hypothetical protein